MKLLLYGMNFFPEVIGTGKYTAEMSWWLGTRGVDVRVLSGYPYYPKWKVFEGYRGYRYSRERLDDVEVLRCPIFVPRRPRALTRILHLLSFSFSSLPILLMQWRWRPDIVFLVVPTLCCAPQTALLAKLTGALSVIHVQDFELDALFGLGMARAGLLKRVASRVERWLLRRFDLVSTISPGMMRRGQEKGVPESRLRLLPNWSETERFRHAAPSSQFLESLGVVAGSKVILYAGNLGEKQGLELIPECAVQFADEFQFLVVGEGPAKARLADTCRLHGVKNVLFAPLQPYELLPTLLASADCHLVIQRRGVADAVMPSKLTNILAVGGNAVITADAETSLGQLCKEFSGIATLVEPESAKALAAGIRQALSLPKPNQIALNYAKEHLSKDRILQRFFDEIEDLVEARKRARS